MSLFTRYMYFLKRSGGYINRDFKFPWILFHIRLHQDQCAFPQSNFPSNLHQALPVKVFKHKFDRLIMSSNMFGGSIKQWKVDGQVFRLSNLYLKEDFAIFHIEPIKKHLNPKKKSSFINIMVPLCLQLFYQQI